LGRLFIARDAYLSCDPSWLTQMVARLPGEAGRICEVLSDSRRGSGMNEMSRTIFAG